MKVVKVFFREPDYYIHDTVETGMLGQAALHGCIREEKPIYPKHPIPLTIEP